MITILFLFQMHLKSIETSLFLPCLKYTMYLFIKIANQRFFLSDKVVDKHAPLQCGDSTLVALRR